MKQRLQKILSDRGVASRRRAEELIRGGLVAVNGETASVGDGADPDVDQITVEGKPLPSARGYIYLMLNKPRGYVTTLSDEKGRPTAASLVEGCGQRVYPVGRLDMDSEGLLLFTNDGAFANRAMHPSHEIEKTYLVQVSGYSRAGFQKLHEPVELDGYQIRPPKLRLRSTGEDRAEFEITIHEGRNRQIRRMCQMAGMQVTRLKRIREGQLELGKLPLGKWRYLTEEERNKI
ncbi:MAG: pseudouridine synthase [Faecousia sp.]